MNKEFEFPNLYFLEETNINNKMSSEDLFAIDESLNAESSLNSVIEISDADNDSVSVAYTYAKFLETLDQFGLEGFVTA